MRLFPYDWTIGGCLGLLKVLETVLGAFSGSVGPEESPEIYEASKLGLRWDEEKVRADELPEKILRSYSLSQKRHIQMGWSGKKCGIEIQLQLHAIFLKSRILLHVHV